MFDGYVAVLHGQHTLALMMLSGIAVNCRLIAPAGLRPVLIGLQRKLWLTAAWLAAIAALLSFSALAGQMGDSRTDMFSPAVLIAVASTQTGSMWLVSGILAMIVLAAALRPLSTGIVLLLAVTQLILLAGSGHAAMREGWPGVLQRANHAFHLLCAAWWLGGLPSVLCCMALCRQAKWRRAAIDTMMRFSRSGHIAVAGVLLTGAVNTLMIAGLRWPVESTWLNLLLLKCALVGLMVAIAVYNRYVLVPRFRADDDETSRQFIHLTQREMPIGVAVLFIASVLAGLAPF